MEPLLNSLDLSNVSIWIHWKVGRNLGKWLDEALIASKSRTSLSTLQCSTLNMGVVVPHHKLLCCTYQMKTTSFFFNRLFFFYYFYGWLEFDDGVSMVSALSFWTNQICYWLFNHVATAQGLLLVLEASIIAPWLAAIYIFYCRKNCLYRSISESLWQLQVTCCFLLLLVLQRAASVSWFHHNWTITADRLWQAMQFGDLSVGSWQDGRGRFQRRCLSDLWTRRWSPASPPFSQAVRPVSVKAKCGWKWCAPDLRVNSCSLLVGLFVVLVPSESSELTYVASGPLTPVFISIASEVYASAPVIAAAEDFCRFCIIHLQWLYRHITSLHFFF